MPCNTINLPGGATAIVCGSRRVRGKCQEPGCTWNEEFLCDFPLTGDKAGQTCDRKCCRQHAKQIGPNRHYCMPHVRLGAAQGAGDVTR